MPPTLLMMLQTSRNIPASAAEVFAAFADPARLARWWGPEGFTNTFDVCEFKPGGRWIYTMHGPDGKDYPNECIFREILPAANVVIDHVILPLYTLTITLAEFGGTTTLTWQQEFDNSVFATKMYDFLTKANEQNLDRLTAEVL